MLTEICDHVHNYFTIINNDGKFEISGGTIPVAMLEGQRFRIRGSALNDGIYTFHSSGIRNDDDTEDSPLIDETFTGSIDAMGVPVNFVKLSQEIAAWVTANSAVLASPYTSESFGGYSYTKASGNANGGGALGWQDMFRSRLNAYRKIS